MDKTSTTAISRWLRSQRGGRGGHHSRNTEPLDGPASQILACSPKRCASLSSGVLSWGRLDVPPRMFSKYSGWCLARCGRSVSIFRIYKYVLLGLFLVVRLLFFFQFLFLVPLYQ